jgi:5-methylcytosine-specific restriction endonuclease McrA
MTTRPCLACGQLVASGSYHKQCDPRRGYTRHEQQRRRRTVDLWVQENGSACPGFGIPPHLSGDLTADHVVSVASGGSEAGALSVLCRSCNGRKRDRR